MDQALSAQRRQGNRPSSIAFARSCIRSDRNYLFFIFIIFLYCCPYILLYIINCSFCLLFKKNNIIDPPPFFNMIADDHNIYLRRQRLKKMYILYLISYVYMLVYYFKGAPINGHGKYNDMSGKLQ